MGQETGFLVAGWSGVVLCSRHPAYVGRSVLIQSDMVVGARSDFPDAAAAVTSRTSVTNGAVAIAACPRDVDANRSIANSQNDCAPKTLASSGASGRVEPSTTVDDARTAAPCRVHSSSSALLPLAVHLSVLQSTSHNTSRYPPAAPACAAEHAHKGSELPTCNQFAPATRDSLTLRLMQRDNERLVAENNTLRQQVASLEALEHLHLSQQGLQQQIANVQCSLAAALGELGADVRAALPRQRSGCRADAAPFEPGAYGRCPLTRREMPREMTADELQFVATDEDLKPPQRKELSYKCPPSDLLELRMRPARSDAMYQATVATARREHYARRFERRDLRVARVVQDAISDRRDAIRAAVSSSRTANCENAEAAHVAASVAAHVEDGGAAAPPPGSCADCPVPSAPVQDYEMHDVLCRLHASGAHVDAATVRLLRQRHGVRFDVRAHFCRQAAYSDQDIIGTAGARSFAMDVAIADERATRERWRGRRKPTGRPDIGSKEARQSKRAKVFPNPTAL